MAKVESFDLDHTKVRAPYVRIAGTIQTTHGDTITKYDLRLVQPNKESLDTAGLHTIEHFLATSLRKYLDCVIDISPMGCRTGFYLITLADAQPENIKQMLEKCLREILTHDGPIPGASEISCGNYLDHSLSSAKKWATQVLENGFILQETV